MRIRTKRIITYICIAILVSITVIGFFILLGWLLHGFYQYKKGSLLGKDKFIYKDKVISQPLSFDLDLDDRIHFD